MRELYENTIRYYRKILFVAIVVITVAEVAFGLYMIFTGGYTAKMLGTYLWERALIPFILSMTVYISLHM